MKNTIIILLSLLTALTVCQNNRNRKKQPLPTQSLPLLRQLWYSTKPPKLGDYWYQEATEISRYELQQNRYADVHPGEAVLIFVTEDFLRPTNR